MFTAPQLRLLLRALVNLDPYTFADEVAKHFASEENTEQTAEDILVSTIDGLTDEKLTSFALRLSLTEHIPKPHDSESDFLEEAEQMFVPKKPKAVKAKADVSTKAKPTAVKASAKKDTIKKEAA